ncbi:ATP synthase [Musa troglodytarum]|uniref:ATP synthase n=1 Tax=Musa troglodytarum TaxID=320322 RepID=A0A9E7FG77_9LILI|nr:ATP synthase [Musa troglodytarum]
MMKVGPLRMRTNWNALLPQLIRTQETPKAVKPFLRRPFSSAPIHSSHSNSRAREIQWPLQPAMYRHAPRLLTRAIGGGVRRSAVARAFSTDLPVAPSEDAAFVEAWRKVAPNIDPPKTPLAFMKPRPPTPSSIPSKLTINFVLPYQSEISNKEVCALRPSPEDLSKSRLEFCSDVAMTFHLLLVDMVIVPATTGQMGVLPGHVATIAELKPGLLSVHEGSEVTKYFVSSGFAFVHANSVTDIVAVEAVPVDRIDSSLVQTGLADFTQKLNSATTDLEKAEAQIGVDVHSALNAALSGGFPIMKVVLALTSCCFTGSAISQAETRHTQVNTEVRRAEKINAIEENNMTWNNMELSPLSQLFVLGKQDAADRPFSQTAQLSQTRTHRLLPLSLVAASVLFSAGAIIAGLLGVIQAAVATFAYLPLCKSRPWRGDVGWSCKIILCLTNQWTEETGEPNEDKGLVDLLAFRLSVSTLDRVGRRIGMNNGEAALAKSELARELDGYRDGPAA